MSRITASTSSIRTSRSRSPTSCDTPARRSRASRIAAASRSSSAGRACTCGRWRAASTRTPCHRIATPAPRWKACSHARGSARPSTGSAGSRRNAPRQRTSPTPGGSLEPWRSPSSPATRPPPPPRGYAGPVAWLGLHVHGAQHREWIGTRARDQFDAGLVEEARGLRERYDPTLPAFSAIGYREAWALLDGEIDRETAIERDAQRNVAFAKRQSTWFRSEPDIEWLSLPDVDPLPIALDRARALLVPRDVAAAKARTRRRTPAVRLDPAKVNAWRVERQLLGRRSHVAGRGRHDAARRPGAGRLIGRAGHRPAIEARARERPGRRRHREGPRRPAPRPLLGDARHAPPLRGRGRARPSLRPLAGRRSGAARHGSAGSASPSPRWSADRDDRRGPRRRPPANPGGARGGDRGTAGTEDRRAPPRQLGQRAQDRVGSPLPCPVGGGRGRRRVRPRVPLARRWREEDQDEALAKLVVRYLAAYGPATLKELLRWWGVARVSVMRPVIERLGDALTEVDIDGTRAYIRTEDLPSIEATRPTKGWFGSSAGSTRSSSAPGCASRSSRRSTSSASRARPAGSRRLCSSTALPPACGTAGGCHRLEITIEPFAEPSPRLRASIESAAREIGRVQGMPVSVVYGSVFPEKAAKAPFNDR